MKFVHIAFKDLRISLRDKKGIALTILMPLILIFILGLTFDSRFGDSGSVSKYKVAFFAKDKGFLAKTLRQDVFGSKEISKMIEVVDTTEQAGKDMVAKGEVSAFVLVPEGFTDQVMRGEKAELELYSDPGKPWRREITKAVLDSFTSQVAAIQTGFEAIDAVTNGIDPRLIPAVMEKLKAENGTGELMRETTRAGRRQVSAFQYYAAGMTVMFLLFTALAGTKSMLEEKEAGTFGRLLITPTQKASFLAGKFLGIMLVSLLQVLAIYLVTRLLFKVDWGSSLPGLALLSLAAVAACAAMAVFVATIAKSSKTADAIGSIVVQVMALLGGSMVPLMVMPKFLQLLGKGTINGWALTGYLKLMEGRDYTAVLPEASVLALIAAVFLAFSLLGLRFQEGGRI